MGGILNQTGAESHMKGNHSQLVVPLDVLGPRHENDIYVILCKPTGKMKIKTSKNTAKVKE